MSSKLERDLDHFLYFGGPFPDLSQGIEEVPMPVVPQYTPQQEAVPVTVHCGWYGNKFVHFDNCNCDYEEDFIRDTSL